MHGVWIAARGGVVITRALYLIADALYHAGWLLEHAAQAVHNRAHHRRIKELP